MPALPADAESVGGSRIGRKAVMSALEPTVGTHDLERVTVADAMHRGVVTCSRDTSLVTVAHLMAAKRIHCVVVVAAMPDGDVKLCGLVTDRDVLAAAVSGDVA